ncbi:SDR family NAD(P)-dependent oxidoreductase, partial [Mycobacterium avium]|uniref:SDR family NAD(P)-dependent oxidoreductase n=1 Tax=Mycobacterium avium TaxID=1764 RepID=UPI001F271E56
MATCDVIVENFTPRVLDAIGLDFATVQSIRADAVIVRMPGFGLTGPWRDNPAFAYVIESASGLSWLTGYPDRTPYDPYSIGDPCAGVHALNAILLALEHRRRTGEGVFVEAAMVDAALSIAAEQVIEYSAYGALLEQGTGGHIAFTASFAGLVPNAGLGTYGVAKYGVVGLAETLAREVKPNGI